MLAIAIILRLFKLYDCMIIAHVWSFSNEDVQFVKDFSSYGELPLVIYESLVGDVSSDMLNDHGRVCFTSFNVSDLMAISFEHRRQRSVKMSLPTEVDPIRVSKPLEAPEDFEAPPIIVTKKLNQGAT